MKLDIFDQIDTDFSKQQIKQSGGDIFDQIKVQENTFFEDLKEQAKNVLKQQEEYGKTALKGIAEGITQLGRSFGPLQDQNVEEKQTQGLDILLPTENEEFGQKALRRGLQEVPSAIATLGGSAVIQAAKGLASGLIGQTGEEAGLPPWAQHVLSLTAYLGPDAAKKLMDSEFKIGKVKKTSGLPERRFENLEKPREVSQGKLNKINEKLESDFKDISSKIIEESPVGQTAKELVKNPTFKQESRDLLNQAQEIANEIKTTIPTKSMRKEIIDYSKKEMKGFAESEYDKAYSQYMNTASKVLKGEEITAKQLVEQYRKNNSALKEYFEPGSSKALNRAKKDSLLDQNKIIADVMEKSFPESNLSPVFKEGNARWTKIMDSEAVDGFISELFKENVNYKKMHDFFDKSGYDRIFKRALGEEGYKSFETLMKDMLSSEVPYKMLKVAKTKGFDDLLRTGMSYVIHPKIGLAKTGLDLLKSSYKGIMNTLLDKPKLGITWKEGVQALKKGDFKKAETKLAEVDKVVKESKVVEKANEIKQVEKAIEQPIEQPKRNLKQKLEKQKEISKKAKEQREKRVEKSQTKEIDLEDYDYKYNPKLGRQEFIKKEKPAESLTKSKIEEVKKLDITPKGLRNQKEFITNKLQDVLDNPSKYKDMEKIPLEVPGDGEFKIHNNEKAIKQFMKNVEKKWPDKPLRKPHPRKYKNYPKEAYKDYEIEQQKLREGLEFRDRFMSQPKGIDQRSINADIERKKNLKK